MDFKWEEIVKIQYEAMLKSSALYLGVLSLLAGFRGQLALNSCSKILISISFFFVLAQSISVLWLIETQRKASWLQGENKDRNSRENSVRKTSFLLSMLATVSVFIVALSIIFS